MQRTRNAALKVLLCKDVFGSCIYAVKAKIYVFAKSTYLTGLVGTFIGEPWTILEMESNGPDLITAGMHDRLKTS